ncbi:MAG: hypothetical protein Q9217_002678 [Psora testacea]
MAQSGPQQYQQFQQYQYPQQYHPPQLYQPPQQGQQYHQPQYYQQQPHPVTPHSAQSPTPNQWRRQNSWHQNQQAYQQNQQSPLYAQYQLQPSPYQPQSFATPTTPATGPQFGPSQLGHVSPTASYHGSATQIPQIAPTDEAALQQRLHVSISNPQQSAAQANGEAVNVDEEPEEDDLNSLDIPDLPRSTKLFGRPMPANFIVADALWPIQPPSAEAKGKCQSKYLVDAAKEAPLQSIKDSPYWKDHEEDTIFIKIPNSGETISIADCRSKIKERQRHPIDNEAPRKSRSQSRSVAPRSAEAAEMAESLETLERALAEAKAKQAEMIRNRKRSKQKQQSEFEGQKQQRNFEDNTRIKLEHQSPPQSAISEKPGGPPQGTEDILASLGVTGAPKPVPKPFGTVSKGSPPKDAALHRSRSSSKELLNTHSVLTQYEQQPPLYQANGTAKVSQQYGHTAHPPPPPPPIQNPSHNNTMVQSPDSGGADPYGYVSNSADSGNGHYIYGTDGQAASPTQYRSDQSLSRKRSYDQRESSSEESDSSRRQEDDITPKHKKRQPKVAAAYR